MNVETFTASGKTAICPICEKDTALEEEESGVKSWLCVNCGYMTTGLYKQDSPSLKNDLMGSPQLIRDMQYYDGERDLVWIPTVINLPGKGMIFPDFKDQRMVWNHAPVVDIPEEERDKYPVPGKEGHFYNSRLAVEQSKVFNRFYDALKSIGAIIQMESLEKADA